jgi:hypothetical protein
VKGPRTWAQVEAAWAEPEAPSRQPRRGRPKLRRPTKKELQADYGIKRTRGQKGLVLITKNQLDRRSAAVRRYDRMLAEIYRDLGVGKHGKNLGAVERLSAEQYVAASLMLEALHVRAMNGDEIETRTYKVLLSMVVRLGARLGLKAQKPVKAEPVNTLAAYLASKGDVGASDVPQSKTVSGANVAPESISKSSSRSGPDQDDEVADA